MERASRLLQVESRVLVGDHTYEGVGSGYCPFYAFGDVDSSGSQTPHVTGPQVESSRRTVDLNCRTHCCENARSAWRRNCIASAELIERRYVAETEGASLLPSESSAKNSTPPHPDIRLSLSSRY
jgi:hypothetical protein